MDAELQARILGPEGFLALLQGAEGNAYVIRCSHGYVLWEYVRYIVRNGVPVHAGSLACCELLANGSIRISAAGSIVPQEHWNTDLGWFRIFDNMDKALTATTLAGEIDSRGQLIHPTLPKTGWLL